MRNSPCFACSSTQSPFALFFLLLSRRYNRPPTELLAIECFSVVLLSHFLYYVALSLRVHRDAPLLSRSSFIIVIIDTLATCTVPQKFNALDFLTESDTTGHGAIAISRAC